MVELQIRSRLGPKCQAVIPKPVREALRIGPGDEIVFRVQDDHVVVERKNARELLEEVLNAYPKRPENKPLDSKRLYYEQIERRLRKAGL